LSGRLPAVTCRELERAARRLGFVRDRQRGSHAVYYRARDGARVVIPVHRGRNIKPKTLAGILEDMGVTPEEFRRLL